MPRFALTGLLSLALAATLTGQRSEHAHAAPEVHRAVTSPTGFEFAPAQGSPYVLAFVGGSYAPEEGLDPRVRQAAARDPEGRTFAYAMIEGSLSAPRRLDELRSIGCRILGVHTWQCLVVDLPLAEAARVADLSYVRWLGYPMDGQKLHPLLQKQMVDAGATQRLHIVVSVFASDQGPDTERVPLHPGEETPDGQSPAEAIVPNGPMQKRLEALGFEFDFYSENGNVIGFTGHATAEQAAAIAGLDFVSFVEAKTNMKPFDDQSMSMIGVDRVRANYDGRGMTAGVIDSGLASTAGNSGSTHSDVNGKTIVGRSTMPQGAFLDQDAHGTHVTGTITGEGRVDSRYVGVVPGLGRGASSAVFVGKFFDANGDPFGNVATLYDFMKQTQSGNPKPRAINCSWGSDTPNFWTGTEFDCRQIDGYVWDHDQLYVFAAGNDGPNWGVGTPGAAKNVLTVGSVEDRWIAQLGVAPGDMSAFSSHSTTDARLKPEIVAPGSEITSLNNTFPWGYANASGTSMAAPHVTGVMTSLIQHYPALDYDPATLKATACASAQWQGSPGGLSGAQDGPGFGLIDAYRMNYADTRGSMFFGYSGPIDNTGDWLSWDVAVPNNARAMKVVAVWLEPAAQAGATVARTNELRMHLDVAPFSSGGTTGEFSVRTRGNDTLLSLVSRSTDPTGLCTTARGKTVRVKVHGHSVPTDARVGLAVLFLTREPNGQMPNHAVTLDRDIVRDGGDFLMTSTLTAPSASDEFQNARLYPVLPSGFWVEEILRTTADGILQRYDHRALHPSSPYPLTSEGMTVGAGAERQLVYRVRAPFNASQVFQVGASFWADPRTGSGLKQQSICVDSERPGEPGNLRSTSHTTGEWSTDPNLVVVWDPAVDAGCAGLDGYAHLVSDSGQRATEKTLPATATTFTARIPDTPGNRPYYYSIRSIDKAGNLGIARSDGPYYVDTTPPVIHYLALNLGNATFRDIQAVRMHFDVRDEQSGMKEYRYCHDDVSWSPWRSLPSSSLPLYFDRYGGNANPGMKTVYIEFRNYAGTIVKGQDDIEYLPVPRIDSSPSFADTIGNEPIVLTGLFIKPTAVEMNAVPLSKSSDDWLTGYYEHVSDSEIHVYPAQGQPATTYFFLVRNGSGADSAGVRFLDPANPTIATEPTLQTGATQTILMHTGSQRGPKVGYVALSASPAPSILPGIVSLDLGDAFRQLIVLPAPVPFDPVYGSAPPVTFPVPASLAGVTIYSQALIVDTSQPNAAPIPVTNRTSTTYR